MSTENYRGYTIKIEHDTDAENPRIDRDCFGTIISRHRRYLGDRDQVAKSLKTPADVERHLKETQAVSLPVYMYDHSGLRLSTTPFNDLWDSGQVGVIFATKEKVIAEYGDFSADSIAKAKLALKGEIDEYDQYLRGDVHFYEILSGEETVESCGGVYDSEEEILELCQGTIDNLIAYVTSSADMTAFTVEQLSKLREVQYTYLDLSTAHLSNTDIERLTATRDRNFPRAIWKEYGLWLNVTTDPDSFAEDLAYMQEQGLSQNLIRAFCAAHKMEACWINFDQDADIVEEILIDKEETQCSK